MNKTRARDEDAYLTSSCLGKVACRVGLPVTRSPRHPICLVTRSPDHRISRLVRPISRSPDCYFLQLLTFSHLPDLADRSTASKRA